ncbi:MAG: hypothetical protein ACLU9S_02170 [Oscillospiraceae bacterium]
MFPIRRPGQELANVKVQVRLSDQDLVELSELVESARMTPRPPKRHAEAAQARAEAAKADCQACQGGSQEAPKEAGRQTAAAGGRQGPGRRRKPPGR